MIENRIAYDHICPESVKHAYKSYHTTNNLCDPLWWWEEHSHDLACSAPGSSPFLGELYATPGGQHTCNSGTLERGVILVSNLDIHLVANMLKGIHVWSPSWPVHDLHILLCQKSSHVTCCVGRDIVPKCPSPQKRHPIEVMPGVDLVVEGSTQYHQLTPPNMVCEHTIPEGPCLPSIGWMDIFVSLSPCPRRTWARPSLWKSVKGNLSLKIQCLQCLRTHLLCVLSHSRRRRLTQSGSDLGDFHSGIPTFRHSPFYLLGNGLQKSHYFILQATSTPEPIDTDQIKSNTI